MEKNDKVQMGTQKIYVMGFGRRLAAALIDGLILLVGTSLLVIAVGLIGVYLNMYSDGEPIPVATLVIICGLILSLLYFVIPWSRSGQTIAKSVLGIKVVGSDGQPLSVGKAFLRYIGYIISAIPFSFGFLWIVFDKKGQGWHDKIASSYAAEGDADILDNVRIEFAPSDAKPGWLWLTIWFLIIMVAPSALLSSLFILGPTVGRIVTNLVSN
jgi:uncharacterized RDD family membrane protein YckC